MNAGANTSTNVVRCGDALSPVPLTRCPSMSAAYWLVLLYLEPIDIDGTVVARQRGYVRRLIADTQCCSLRNLISTCRASGHPGITHWCERTPDDGLRRRDDMQARTAHEPIRRRCSEPHESGDAGQQNHSQFHLAGPLNSLGSSSTSPRSATSIFLALVALLKAKVSAATSLPVFQSRTWTLYCGPWSRSFDVMT